MRTLSGLRAGLLLVAIGVIAAPSRAADSDKLLPNDANFVVTINVKQMIASPLFKKLDDKFNIKEALKKDPSTKQALETTGLDPLKDVDQVIMAGSGGKQEELLFLILGKFDKTKLEAAGSKAAQDDKNGLKILKEGGYTLYEMTNKKDGQVLYGAIMDNSTIAASLKKDYLLDALDKKAGKKKSSMKKDLVDLLPKADTKQSVAVVAVSEGLGGPGAQEVTDKLKNIIGTINVTDDVKLNFNLAAKDEAAAKDVAKQIDEGLGQVKAFAGIMAAQNKQLAPVIDILGTLKVEAKGTNVSLKGEVTKDIIDKLIKGPQQ
jgi:hypothetical protein